MCAGAYQLAPAGGGQPRRQRCARAPTHDIPGQLSNFDGEQVTWGPWS